jgi:hypothetical protein
MRYKLYISPTASFRGTQKHHTVASRVRLTGHLILEKLLDDEQRKLIRVVHSADWCGLQSQSWTENDEHNMSIVFPSEVRPI